MRDVVFSFGNGRILAKLGAPSVLLLSHGIGNSSSDSGFRLPISMFVEDLIEI